MQDLKSLRAAIARIPKAGRGRRFPAPLKSSIVEYVIAARRRGVRTAQLEAELSISWETLRRWSQQRRPPIAPVAVEVVADELRSGAVHLVSPTGWRIEGLNLDDVRSLVNR